MKLKGKFNFTIESKTKNKNSKNMDQIQKKGQLVIFY